ncbi:MAG: FAD-binding oxidoreductase [Clostridiales bacterium]|nr:FAD-binding oxidoreductase [Clostridiales bacterium]
MNTFNTVTLSILSDLEDIVGTINIITDKEQLFPYSHDEVPGKKYRAFPDVVVKPASAEEVAAVMKIAHVHHLPVTPRGAGTGLAGGAVPVYGGIVLSLERMDRILDYDLANLTITVEPGVITKTINERLARDNLFYPGYPMSKESCSVGGNVATNAGGGHAVKYGVTGRYVLGLEVVLPTGEIMQIGGKRVKDVTGYNLVSLLVGSEGTLAVITTVCSGNIMPFFG